jgi:hypothetical protein
MNKKIILKNIDIGVNIVVFLAGIAVPVLFENVTKSNIKDDMIRVMFYVYGIGSIILIITMVIMRKILKEAVTDNSATLEEINGSIHEIAERVYPSFELLPPKGGLRNSFTVVIDLLKVAKDVVVLDYFPWGGSIDPHQDEKNSLFKKYYEALDAFIDRDGHYKRLIQLPDGRSEILLEKDIADPIAIAHLKKALLLSQKFDTLVSLKTCQVFIPNVSFLIIDGCYISWEVPSLDTNNTFEFGYDFYIVDPKKKVTNELLSMIAKIDNQSTPVSKIT